MMNKKCFLLYKLLAEKNSFVKEKWKKESLFPGPVLLRQKAHGINEGFPAKRDKLCGCVVFMPEFFGVINKSLFDSGPNLTFALPICLQNSIILSSQKDAHRTGR
jgi:hypothetical protein